MDIKMNGVLLEPVTRGIKEEMGGIADAVGQSVGQSLTDSLHDFGVWLLQVSPDGFMLASMTLCLGAIIGSGKSAKLSAFTLLIAIILDVTKRSVLG